MPNLDWEVTNQAHVHLWFEQALKRDVSPIRSFSEGVSTWPEYATCVGVYLDDDESIGIVAPHGLGDLFEMRVRHNPVRAGVTDFNQRIQSKRFIERWPQLVMIEA